MSQILVTGGCGYIGSHLVKRLVDSGEDVVVYDNLSNGKKNALPQGVELVIGDIRDQTSLKKIFASHQIEAVMHLAALVNAAESIEKPDLYQSVNDLGSHQVWKSAHSSGTKIFLYASSAAVYGIPTSREPITESASLAPTNPYGAAKLSGEQSLKETIGEDGSYSIFRFFNVAGAEKTGKLGQSRKSRAIMQRLFAVAAGDDQEIVISGHDYDTVDGTVIRDFVHVEDIVGAFLLGLAHLHQRKPSFVCNLGLGQPTSMLELVEIVESVTGKKITIKYGPRNPGDIDYSVSDIALAKKIIGWRPNHNVRQMVESGWNAYVNEK